MAKSLIHHFRSVAKIFSQLTTGFRLEVDRWIDRNAQKTLFLLEIVVCLGGFRLQRNFNIRTQSGSPFPNCQNHNTNRVCSELRTRSLNESPWRKILGLGSARDLDSIVRIDILLFAATVYYTHLQLANLRRTMAQINLLVKP